MRIKNNLVSFMSLIVCLALPTAILSAPVMQSFDQIAAIVNDDIISQSELNTKVNDWMTFARQQQPNSMLPAESEISQMILDRLIDEKVQLQLAHKTGIDIDDISIQQAIKEQAEHFNMTVAELQEKLREENMSITAYRSELKNAMIMQQLHAQYLHRNLAISDQEINNFINSPAGQAQLGIQYKLQHFFFPAADTTESDNKTVAELIAANAMDKLPESIESKILDWRAIQEVPTLFVGQIPSMKQDEVLGPIATDSGAHYIKLLGKRSGQDSKNLTTQYHVKQILVQTNEQRSDKQAHARLNEIFHQLEQQKGQNFSELAKRFSDEKFSAVKGGDLDWIEKDAVLAPFYNEVIKLKPGQYSKPFKTSLGWHIVQLIGSRDQTQGLDGVRAHAQNILYREKLEAKRVAWISKLREEAKIELFAAK